MKSTLFRLGAAGMAAALLLSLSACGNKNDGDATSTTTTTVAPTTVATTAAPSGAMNLLTGETLEGKQNRPMAFMIGNYGYSSTIQQKNIDKADLYVEAETEGGISRIMAVFGSIENVPAEIGPVRSARTHFVKIVKSLDAMYCHIGGSVQADKLIPSLGVTDMGSSAAKVSSQLKAANGATEHTKVFQKDKLLSLISKRGISTTSAKKSPYAFGTKVGDGAGNTVQVNTSGSWKTSFTYDAATGLYTKHRTTPTSDAHKSYDGDAIKVSNVIIMYDTRYQEDAGHISFKLDSGSGILVSGGKSRQIRWSRTNDQLSFTETDGTALTVAKGKTYILLTDNSHAGKTVLQ